MVTISLSPRSRRMSCCMVCLREFDLADGGWEEYYPEEGHTEAMCPECATATETVNTPILTTYGALIDSLNHDYADMRHVIVWFADDSILDAVMYPATVVRVLSVMGYHDKEVALEHFRMEQPDTRALYTKANGWFTLRGYLEVR